MKFSHQKRRFMFEASLGVFLEGFVKRVSNVIWESKRLKPGLGLELPPSKSIPNKSLLAVGFVWGFDYYCFGFDWPGPIITFFVSTFFCLFAFYCMKLLILLLGSSLYPGSTKICFWSYVCSCGTSAIPIKFLTVFKVFL